MIRTIAHALIGYVLFAVDKDMKQSHAKRGFLKRGRNMTLYNQEATWGRKIAGGQTTCQHGLHTRDTANVGSYTRATPLSSHRRQAEEAR